MILYMEGIMEEKNATKKDNGFSFKERLILTLLVTISLPVMLFITGTVESFGMNTEELEFVISDFIGWNLIYALSLFAILTAILLPLKNKAFDIAYSIIFALGFMFFLQGNYLNLGVTSLVDDGAEISVWKVYLDIAFWILIGGGIIFAFLFFRKKRRDIVKTVATVALIAVSGVQCVSMLTLALTSDAFMSKGQRVELNAGDGEGTSVLTYKNIDKLGKDNNVIYFVIDRFDYEYYMEAMEECPEIFEELEGFTSYTNATSLYGRTFPSIAYMLTGVKNDFTKSRSEYFDYAFDNGSYLEALKQNGYDINIYSDIYHSYDDAEDFNGYASNTGIEGPNYSIKGEWEFSSKVTLLSLYKYFPHFAKYLLPVNSSEFGKYVIRESEDTRYTTDMRDLYYSLTEKDMEIDGDKKFSFIHFSGCHIPYLYNEDFNRVFRNSDVMSAMKQSFKIINRYISEMKRLGVYDDATIVITGDHGNITFDEIAPVEPHTISILYKPSGASEGKMAENSAPVSQENIMPEIFKSEGLSVDGLATALTDINEDSDIVRTYEFQRKNSSVEYKYEQIIYEIIGDANDFENWTIVDRYKIEDNIYKR